MSEKKKSGINLDDTTKTAIIISSIIYAILAAIKGNPISEGVNFIFDLVYVIVFVIIISALLTKGIDVTKIMVKNNLYTKTIKYVCQNKNIEISEDEIKQLIIQYEHERRQKTKAKRRKSPALIIEQYDRIPSENKPQAKQLIEKYENNEITYNQLIQQLEKLAKNKQY